MSTLLLLPVGALLGCGGDGPAHEGPGTNITQSTGLDIADLRVGSPSPDPFPPGASALVLARLSTTGAEDRLLSASSTAADAVVLLGADGQRVHGLTVPAGRPLDLTRQGPRIRLDGLKHLLREGDWLPLELTFERAGLIRTRVQRRVDADGSYTRPATGASIPASRQAGAGTTARSRRPEN